MTKLVTPLHVVLIWTLLASLALLSQAAEDTQQVLKGRHHQLTYIGGEAIPAFNIAGLPARIHTQGIYVTDDSLYVTGRLEHESRRALLLRFSRNDLSQVEFLDVTPALNDKQSKGRAQDHPGGFDYDGQAFWIPVAVSKPHTPTAIVRIQVPLDSPISNVTRQVIFTLDDHIGALAIDQKNGRIFGANWDTKIIYSWSFDGTELARTPREKLVNDNPNWALAVQDWKHLTENTILAGGYDKDPHRETTTPRAVLDWLDIRKNKLIDRIRIVGPQQQDSLTREGMALHDNKLFLLPGDLGNDAVLYQYRLESTSK